ncbi:AzlD domain-containing protein [Nisaea acidiphila]|uniref:AzlD domain-containing protein n=1 Tax=Nisaea acidiphila TaxID=1862145 RepID=A0A9J7ANB2_9PROT|nr:AzlD domain-containing protein [Nisaea acidiphila]UUX48928.1 AzlD domain-containing protein [Nisaea acidiphila]
MNEHWQLISGLAFGTYAIRLGGYLIGARLPATGAWARSFAALPGCLISALVAVILVQGGPADWVAAGAAIAVALATRNLPLTMAAGIAAVWLARQVL